jgi:hypothetical protein
VRAYSISAVEASSRLASDATLSVPRPVSRSRSAESDGGERKMKMGERVGWLALMSLTPCSRRIRRVSYRALVGLVPRVL